MIHLHLEAVESPDDGPLIGPAPVGLAQQDKDIHIALGARVPPGPGAVENEAPEPRPEGGLQRRLCLGKQARHSQVPLDLGERGLGRLFAGDRLARHLGSRSGHGESSDGFQYNFPAAGSPAPIPPSTFR